MPVEITGGGITCNIVQVLNHCKKMRNCKRQELVCKTYCDDP